MRKPSCALAATLDMTDESQAASPHFNGGARPRMRIAHLFEGTLTGGAVAVLRSIVEHLDRSCFEPVLLAALPGNAVDSFTAAGYSVHVIGSDFGPAMNRILSGGIRSPWPLIRLYASMQREGQRLRQLLLQERIAVLHTHHHHHHLLGSVACDRIIPHLWHLHAIIDRDSNHGIPWRVFNWYAARRAQQIIAISQAVRDCMGRSARRKIQVVYNAIDIARFARSDPVSCKHALGVRAQDRVVGAVGRFDPIKGFRDFVEMACLVAERVPDVQFVLVGPAESNPDLAYRQDCLRRIDEAGLTQRFRVTGELRDPAAFMAGIDVLVLPTTTWEGLGLVVLEAHACGRPVVATACGGPAEIVEDGITGFVVSRRDTGAMAERVIQLLGNPDLLRRMGTAAQERARKGGFEIRTAVSRIEAIYRSLAQT